MHMRPFRLYRLNSHHRSHPIRIQSAQIIHILHHKHILLSLSTPTHIEIEPNLQIRVPKIGLSIPSQFQLELSLISDERPTFLFSSVAFTFAKLPEQKSEENVSPPALALILDGNILCICSGNRTLLLLFVILFINGNCEIK